MWLRMEKEEIPHTALTWAPGQEKEGETQRDMEVHSGEGITGVGIKILG